MSKRTANPVSHCHTRVFHSHEDKSISVSSHFFHESWRAVDNADWLGSFFLLLIDSKSYIVKNKSLISSTSKNLRLQIHYTWALRAFLPFLLFVFTQCSCNTLIETVLCLNVRFSYEINHIFNNNVWFLNLLQLQFYYQYYLLFGSVTHWYWLRLPHYYLVCEEVYSFNPERIYFFLGCLKEQLLFLKYKFVNNEDQVPTFIQVSYTCTLYFCLILIHKQPISSFQLLTLCD